ncbi:MAG: malto-oligosyltrehalose synthase [Paracoccaceae bacterium]
MTPLPTATYRLQLRNGVDFAAAETFLPVLEAYHISHLYLSPIFAPTSGSTHGYDITDPNTIDPVLGGRAGFERLCAAARARGIGIILDIVPNHTAFSMENAWLRDVLRHGQHSPYASHFEIDWSRPLPLPFLPRPFEECVAAGEIGIAGDEDGPVMTFGDLRIPLSGEVDPSGDMTVLHARQAWRLVPWTLERDAIGHRRFFSVTGLIGMRVEDRAVFDDMHSLTFELVRDGLVQGLRVDHVDGLADPAGYLGWLADAVPAIPIWVEKILVEGEKLPEWPVAGTTGYEAAQKVAQLLTDPGGHAQLLDTWREETGETRDFHAIVQEAKAEVLTNDLAAELHQLIALADAALEAAGEMHGPEAIREAVLALLVAFPRYRTYLNDRDTAGADRAVWTEVRDRAAETVRLRGTIDAVCRAIVDPDDRVARTLRRRIQQVTGAVLAKAHEDTAGFRQTAYLAANEVGADPDRPTITAEDVQTWLHTRGPGGLTLTSSHDTKRSEDARMRLVAISHAPDAFLALWADANELTETENTDPALRWYLVQSVLAIWDGGSDEMGARLADHMIKAAREGKSVSNWVAPDAEAEGALLALSEALVKRWRTAEPEALDRLMRIGARLSLVQLAVKCLLPGIPDFYGEAIGAHFALTDPDNRRAVSPEALLAAADAKDLDGDKARLTRDLLRLRTEDPAFFEHADTMLTRDGDDLVLVRRAGCRVLSAHLSPTGREDGGQAVHLRDEIAEAHGKENA